MKRLLFFGLVMLWTGDGLHAAPTTPLKLAVKMEPEFHLQNKQGLVLKVTVTNKGSSPVEFDGGWTGDLTVVSAGTWTPFIPRSIMITGTGNPVTTRLAEGESTVTEYTVNHRFTKVRAGANEVRFRLTIRHKNTSIPALRAESSVTYRLTPRMAGIANSPTAKSRL